MRTARSVAGAVGAGAASAVRVVEAGRLAAVGSMGMISSAPRASASRREPFASAIAFGLLRSVWRAAAVLSFHTVCVRNAPAFSRMWPARPWSPRTMWN